MEEEPFSDKKIGRQLATPLIIQVVNSALIPGNPTANVDIGDSYTNRMLSNFGQPSNIAITSTISGVDYTEWLASCESKPFKVGRTMIISSTAGQIEQPITITHKNVAGKREDFVIAPTIDPNQSQTDRVIDDTEYIFDGDTRIRLAQVDLSTTVSVRVYPIIEYSATQIVAGRKELVNFSEPNLVKTAKVSVI